MKDTDELKGISEENLQVDAPIARCKCDYG